MSGQAYGPPDAGIADGRSEDGGVPAWKARRQRVETTADAILAALAGGEWVPVWPTLCDAQLRDEQGLVDVALVESIEALRRRGLTVERRERLYTTDEPPAYRVVLVAETVESFFANGVPGAR